MNNTQSAGLAAVRPIRVLHVLEATGGGTMRYMENIAAATEGTEIISAFAYGLARADSHLLPFLDRIKKQGWQTYPIDMRRKISVREDLAAFNQLRRAVKDFVPDVLHCHSSKAGALGRAAALTQSPSPICLYSPHALAAPLGLMYLRIEKLLARHTDRFIAVSESEQREIVGFSLAKEEGVGVIYPSVDAEYFKPSSREQARRLLGFDAGPIILAIGRFTEQKNPESFIAILELLHTRLPNVKAIWVGSGEREAAFRTAAAAAGLDGAITIVPWLHDVRPYIAAADVLLSTSKFESFGYATAEALAMKLPVVASDVTGTRDIMKGPLQEWLYAPGDHERAADLLFRMLEDSDRAAMVGNLGHAEVNRRFTTAHMREALVGEYSKSVTAAPRKSIFSMLW